MAAILRALYGWFPRITLPLLLPPVNRIHALQLALETASAFGVMRSWRIVVIGADIHL
jgi:hypothetical protein